MKAFWIGTATVIHHITKKPIEIDVYEEESGKIFGVAFEPPEKMQPHVISPFGNGILTLEHG